MVKNLHIFLLSLPPYIVLGIENFTSLRKLKYIESELLQIASFFQMFCLDKTIKIS